MKPIQTYPILRCALLAGLLGGLGTLNSHGQYTFNSGSDGTYGAMDITTNTTLALPTNGIFNCTTINIASGATLKFTTNALNTPVYLLAQSNVTINGTIDVSGSLGTAFDGGVGGPGGFAGGSSAQEVGLPAGDGHGPGAGRTGANGGAAAYGTAPNPSYPYSGAVYGSPLLVPLVGGSGGSGKAGTGGAGGGGAIQVASSVRIDLAGTVSAAGPRGAFGPGFGMGSGGAVRLVAPIIAGGGSVNVVGTVNGDPWSYWGQGGDGRIRIDCMDRRSLRLNYNPPSVASCGANMVAMSTNAPRLDVTQAGTNNIRVGTGAAVFFTLPQDSSTNQTVTVQASNFASQVPIRVVLTPDNGPSSSYDTNIDNTVSPASVTVPVVVPVNVQVQVNAWTR